ncbi:MAG: lytic transglycosylase domain-containing protein [Thermoanaerobaculia bacterium]
MRSRTASRLALLALLAGGILLGLPRSAHASLVILTDGSVLKVLDFTVEEDSAVLTFAKGGSIRMSMLRVERVVDDEVVAQPEKAVAVLEATAVDFPVRFSASSKPPASAFGDLIFAAARKHKVNPDLVVAVIRAESAFNPRALSGKGARGLMQLMPATAKRYGVRTSELFQPERNIEAGVRYLDFLVERFAGDLPRILAGYNAGEGSVDRFGGVPPYRETQGYVRRILGYLGLAPSTAKPPAR